VDDPLRSTGWALDLDGKPDLKHAWQKLAAARALFEPEAARHLPCQIDGTCNGLQHYAALGRDPDGAAAVNLTPQDQPADVYSAVAEALRPILEREAAAGKAEAKLALSQLSRGLVKQPVMTTVYGVTELGARRQVQTKLDTDADADARYRASRHVAQRVLDAMATVCTSAAELMRWMRACASIIAKQERIVTWRTPIGFPVRQAGPEYHRLPSRAITTANHRLDLRRHSDKAPPKVGKQTRGLPPNYVHSIDSTHLLCAAIAAADEGISLASVHDAYWSHAGTMDRLTAILRDQFVALHERDLTDELHQQLREQSARPLPEPPEPGSFDVRQVLDAPYAFA
jgi:DNA-directed RNA polymerase